MSAIHTLRDLVAKSRQMLINASAHKARKRHFKVPEALDNWQTERLMVDPSDFTEQEQVIEFLRTEYSEKFLFWSRHVELLRSEERKGWGKS